jgi:glycosyltransferase involved in cell wall biosynthesis
MNCSILIPVYKGQETLSPLIERLNKVLPEVAKAYEVILVNDGSPDQSWPTIQQLAQLYPWVHGIDLMRNSGQHNATLCAIRAARYDVIITMDDDLQHPPEEIPLLLTGLTDEYDVVYGTPQQEQHGVWRDLSSQITKLALQAVVGAKTARKVSAFRAFRTHLRDAFASYQGPHPSIDVLLSWGTTRFGHVPVCIEPRQTGKSNYNFYKLVTHAMNMMTGFSTLPLQFASIIGFIFTLFGAGVFIYVIGRYLLHGVAVQGFTFLASVVAIFSGAQLFALGIIGEYLARMHFRLMDRPVYTVREHTPICGLETQL